MTMLRQNMMNNQIAIPAISPTPINIPLRPCILLALEPKYCVCPTQVPNTPE